MIDMPMARTAGLLLDAAMAAKEFMEAEHAFSTHLGRKVARRDLKAAVERAERYKDTKKRAQAAIKAALRS